MPKRSCYIGLILLFPMFVSAQLGYQKDSLQIKVYTEITYKNSVAEDIEVTKVFCDYCSSFQKKAIGAEAKRRSYLERNTKTNRLDDGVRRLALYIRISKADFAALKEKEPDNQNKRL